MKGHYNTALMADDRNTRIQENKKPDIMYSVYIHLPANQNNRYWEKTTTTADAELALEQAAMLYGSEKYPRVEVMRQFFCHRRRKRISEPLQIFEQKKKHGLSKLTAILAGLFT